MIEDLAQQFQAALEASGKSVAELARETDIAPATILKIQTQSKMPSFTKLTELVVALNAEISISSSH